MAIQIGARPDSGFDDPLGMLKDCHRRIESFLGILCIVAERAKGRDLTDEERSAVEAALHYFRVGGQRHTADEEESLFPRLRVIPATGTESIGGLEDDHRHIKALHASIEDLFSTWISAGKLGAESEWRLLSDTAQLRRIYLEHILVEETLVFPHAAQVLNRSELAAIGSEFRARRK
jgi:hemerythrin-like domain-containing protein